MPPPGLLPVWLMLIAFDLLIALGLEAPPWLPLGAPFPPRSATPARPATRWNRPVFSCSSHVLLRKAIGAQDNISGRIPAALGAAGEGSGGPAPEPP